MFSNLRPVLGAAGAILVIAAGLLLSFPAGAQSDSPSAPPEPPTISTAFGEFRCDDKQSEEVKRSPICRRWEKALAAWRQSSSGASASIPGDDEVRDQLHELCIDPASSRDQDAKLGECRVVALDAGYRTGILEPSTSEPEYQFEESGMPSVGIVGVRRHGRGGAISDLAVKQGSNSCPDRRQKRYQCVGVGSREVSAPREVARIEPQTQVESPSAATPTIYEVAKLVAADWIGPKSLSGQPLNIACYMKASEDVSPCPVFRQVVKQRLAALATVTTESAVSYLVVINANNPYSASRNEMLAEIKSIYLGEQLMWPDSLSSAPFARPPDHPANQAFAKLILNMSLPDLALHWKQRALANAAYPPPQIESVHELLRSIARNEGAFGVIRDGETEFLPAKVRVLFRFPVTNEAALKG